MAVNDYYINCSGSGLAVLYSAGQTANLEQTNRSVFVCASWIFAETDSGRPVIRGQLMQTSLQLATSIHQSHNHGSTEIPSSFWDAGSPGEQLFIRPLHSILTRLINIIRLIIQCRTDNVDERSGGNREENLLLISAVKLQTIWLALCGFPQKHKVLIWLQMRRKFGHICSFLININAQVRIIVTGLK